MSKTVSKDKVKHIAKLAKLKLSDKEVNKFSSQLSDVLDYMSQLSKLKLAGKKTAPHMTITNRFRSDKIDKTRVLTQKQALSQAKKSYQGYFVVKAIFE